MAIPHHVFTSDLLRTEYIKYLASQYRVVVLTPMIDREVAAHKQYFQSPNVTYSKWEIERPRFWSFFKFLRISLVGEFDYLKSIRYWYRRPNYRQNWRRRLLRGALLPLTKILKADWFTALEALLLPRSRRFAGLVKEYQPDLLVTAAPGFDPMETELIHQARKTGLATAAVNFTWDNLTANAKHIRKTDFLIAWNDIMKKEAVAIHGFPPDKVFVSGTPRFDVYFKREKNEPTREDFLSSKGLDPKHQTIFHTTVTRAYPFQKKYIRDLIAFREQKKIPYVNLFIRIHPLDVYENYREFSGTPHLYVEKAGSAPGDKIEMRYEDLLNLKYSLMYTDLNINYASTITIEACIFDKPIINIGYTGIYALAYDFDHYRPIYEGGAVRLAKTDEELAELINLYLDNPALDRENRRRVVEDFVKFTDGRSYQRSVDLLDKIISNR